jgi:hypothetical protein
LRGRGPSFAPGARGLNPGGKFCSVKLTAWRRFHQPLAAQAIENPSLALLARFLPRCRTLVA